MWYVANVHIVPENHGLIVAQFFFTTLAILSVLMRMYTRLVLVKNTGLDDLFIVLAMIGTTAYFTAVIFQIKFGLGDAVELSVIQQFLQSLLATVVSYSFTQLCVKFSILFQCKRIFLTPLAQKIYLGYLIYMTVYGLFCLLSSLVTCVPIAKYWNASLPGGCLNRSNLHYALAGFNIINDIGLLVTPMPFLRNLQMARKSKIILMAVFACGSFACIVAIVRLHALYVNNSAPIQQQPIKGVSIALWSGLEINVATICACVPSLKPLVVKAFPRLFTSLADSSKRSRTGRDIQGSFPLRSFDNRSRNEPDSDDMRMGIKVHHSFEMKAVAVGADDDSEKNLVADNSTNVWSTECYAGPQVVNQDRHEM